MRWVRKRREDSSGDGIGQLPASQKKHEGLEAEGSGHSSQYSLPVLVDTALGTLCWPKDVPTAPLWPSPFFPFIFIYLLTFMKFPFHPIPIAHVVLTIP